jgi:hypothetical protein
MRGHLKRYVLGFGFVLVAPSLALAAFSFQTIDRPRAVDTLPSGINDEGWIVGTSETSAQITTNTEEGFLLREGTYNSIFFPPPSGETKHSSLGGINDQGKIVGTWDSTSEDHCFWWDEENGYTSFDPPLDTGESPDCNGINKGGDTVGSYTDTMGVHGWLRKANGAPSTVDFNNNPLASTEAYGINKDGDIVGLYQDALGGDHGFLRHNGRDKTVDFNNMPTSHTNALGINDEGDIVGSYTDNLGDHGFLLREGKYKTVDVNITGAETNKVTGINNRGCMVGVYTYGNEHGFKAGLRAVDGDGEEAGKKGGRAYMHVHEDDCIEQPDREDYSDPSAGKEFHSTQNTAVTYDSVAHSVTIAGLGTNNGSQVAFTIIMVPSNLVPPGIFSITLSDGYSNTGSLLAGAITLH